MPRLLRTRHRTLPALLVVGTLGVVCGVIVIWAARLSVPYPVYVSELGAEGAPTAGVFSFALLLIAGGGLAVALASGHIRSSVQILDRWTPAVSIGCAAGCFVLASQVTCTAACPVPLVDPRSTVQDLVHTTAAVLGFGAACFAMLQVAFSERLPRVARFSLASCMAVASITIVGGLLAIVRVATGIGSWLELIGTTIAIVWMAAYSLALARIPVASG